MKEQELSEKFKQFRISLKPSQFNSIEFLSTHAEAIKATDPELSLRIFKRVRNLQANAVKRTDKKIRTRTKNSSIDPPSEEQLIEKKEVEIKSPQHTDTKTISSSEAKYLTEGEGKKVTIDESESRQALEKPELELQQDEFVEERNNLSFYATCRNWIGLNSFKVFVVFPVLLFTFYQTIWASPRYESRAQLIVQQPDGMATMDASMALLSGLGVNTANTDTQLAQAYIYSNDMLTFLNNELGLREHFEGNGDFFSRMHAWNSQEDFIAYFAKRVVVEIDEKSQVITVYSQAFTEDFAQRLATAIADKAEWYINDIGHQLADAQLKFIRGEHEIVEQRLQKAQTDLLTFQQQYNLLNPEAEGSALSQIAYGIEGQIASKRAELKALKSIMSESAPQVVNLENQLRALVSQLDVEKQRLTQQGQTSVAPEHEGDQLSVSEVLAKFADLKIELELALKAFTSSTISLEKSRIEAYRQLKYLVVVESPTLPEDNSYPQAIYNITLLSVLLLMLYGIGRIVFATIEELK
ncbi:lipopolysaccharide biosynthesis protein [Vibrio sp. SCSIO 43135]|uniref:lipopolysaccharide biosynthesis protein n=1 Tax=Vibrio sp. SCSIO 43135 TaxID=2819096 RepID=UPI002074EAF0|nr:lipopolysaccharide biosynthesis protein [Vibrio sp. SCSIO 43135]